MASMSLPYEKPTTRHVSVFSLGLVYLLLLLRSADSAPEFDGLFTTLMANYSRKIIPGGLPDNVTVIQVESRISSVNEFEEISGELCVSLVFQMSWFDPRLSWIPHDHGGIQSILLKEEDVWIPHMFMMQPFDQMAKIGHDAIVRVYSTGEVFWVTHTVFCLSCSVNVRYFPFDIQYCDVSISGWNYDRSEMILNSTIPILRREYYTGNGQWQLLESPVLNCVIGDFTQGPSLINIVLTLRRRSDFYIVYVIIPIIFLGLLNVLVFMIPPSSGERASVSVTMFLSFSVFMSSLNSIVPSSSSPIAILYYYFLFLMVYSSSITCLIVVSLRIHDRISNVPLGIRVLVYTVSLAWVKHAIVKALARLGVLNGRHNRPLSGYLMGISWTRVAKMFDKTCLIALLALFAYLSTMTFYTLLTQNQEAPKEAHPYVECT